MNGMALGKLGRKAKGRFSGLKTISLQEVRPKNQSKFKKIGLIHEVSCRA